ncbi:hypothetical protein OJAV_G00110810 [Oryzias javanicus]|uniref:Ig-like domain-containing protein n=1 Tax=Oryzias javanicus TaxID=123683 RepID=A0A437CVW5_ORYJA|nr:hypothetical protein OJAV_G00110810 [Oryzias javanicus]
MARESARWYFMVVFLIAAGINTQTVRVKKEVEAFPSETVNLHCEFNGERTTKFAQVLIQVLWKWESVDGQKDIIAVYHPNHGRSFPSKLFKNRVTFLYSSVKNPTIRISKLKMSDAGYYTCEFSTFPSGNERGITTLIMLAKPKNSADIVTVLAGTNSVVAHTTSGPDGMVTVRSEYWLVPHSDDNDKEVTCVVDQRTQEQQWTKTLRLSVEYSPFVSIVGYDRNWYVGRLNAELVCQVNANPPPTDITWKLISGHLPDSVVVENNRLSVNKVDDAVNTTFICEVKNKHGTSSYSITVLVIEASEGLSSVGIVAAAVIGSILALLLVAAPIGVLLTCKRQQRSGHPNNDGQ